MNYFKMLVLSCILISWNGNKAPTDSLDKDLIIIEQNYTQALAVAAEEKKLLFIDFYTSWCAPCKKLDTLIFQNDSLSRILGRHFVLLKYDAEQDKVFHLSKKHHINSYPTGLIVNQEGYVVNRQYGFSGDSVADLSKSVFEFTNQSIRLHQENKILKGYSNTISLSKYPQFYIDYVNRDDKKVKTSPEFEAFWTTDRDFLIEENFSTLVYFANAAPSSIADQFLAKKEKYMEWYGKKDVDVALMFFTMGKFEAAIATKSQEDFNAAITFSEQALSKKLAGQLLSFFEPQFLEAEKK